LEAMAARGQAAGLKATIVTNCLNSEASQFGIELAKEINRVEANTLLLYGGETTVKIKGAGRGGRNQELVLAALPFIDEFSLIVSIASDGVDNSDHAGAFCDMVTKRKAESLKLDINKYLANNDSYTFFDQTKDFLFTGPTGSNVSDLVLAIKK
ncbi:MAG: MOFRL family protein, partial [Patescibacteria group bacterium]